MEYLREAGSRTLGLPVDAEPFVAGLGAEGDAAHRPTAENLSGERIGRRRARKRFQARGPRDQVRISWEAWARPS